MCLTHRGCFSQVYFEVKKSIGESFTPDVNPDTVGYVNQHGLSRKHIFDSVKHSLERLQLDYIDVLQCHRFDKDTPIEETVSTCVVRLMSETDM